MIDVKYRFDIKQGTEEWHKAKDLKLSASRATAIMSNGKGLKTLVRELMVNHYSSNSYPEYSSNYKNASMQRGNDFESKARTIYELETGNKVQEVGLVEMGEYVAVSPDGLIDEDGLIEIKNLEDKVFLELAYTGHVDSNHRNQMQMQLFVTGRKWVDYWVFNPNFNPCYIRKRFYPDMDDFMKIREGINSGIKLIKKEKAILDEMFKVGD